ncbi:O-methyltransferase MdmC protein [Marine Group I thaumarchaeote SCGC AAA799-P11]|uniref:O-methyltransferase MdmC protein n=1 Tax=Marine Group I thaumarchaeote SCGC AAA799-P11 TaxID=1502295 RepID=A0A087S145_9ARCH|nr:O-methyltransferase MdmC protein [Marine Group I thaumarchaeote SCGC AAA799-P11]
MKTVIFEVLEKLENQSVLEKSRKVDVPADERMLAITKETGEILNMIIRIKNAKNMLEVGMSVGYSTLWCAEAITENDGKIITIEQNPKKIKRAKENFQNANVSDAITIKEGLAMQILREFNLQEKYKEFFDFVLIDADKENVIEYFDMILPLVTVGGVIVTDNILYPEKYREDMKKYSAHIRATPNVRTITSPIGNGEEITIKLR